MSNDAASAATDGAQSLVPKLRFPQFRNAEGWKPCTLREFLTEPKEKNRQLEYGPEHVLSVSGEHGCVNQIEYMGRSYAGISVKEYNVVRTGDIVYTKSPLKACPNGIIKANKGPTGIVSVLYAVYRPTDAATSEFLDQYFSSDHKLNTYLQPLVKKGPKNSILVSNSDVLKGRIGAPGQKERRKIADCLSSLDAVIAAEGDRLAGLHDYKKGLLQTLFPPEGQGTPRRRFPEFQGTGDWTSSKLDQVLTTVAPAKKFQSKEYQPTGQFPIVDQGQPLIAGWTDDPASLITEPLPVIVFGDHTCILKYVDFSFAQGADGIKILKPTDEVSVKFLFYALQANPLQSGKYKRHFSDLIARSVAFPDVRTGEQQKVAECLTSLDKAVAALTSKVDTLKTHKSSLMQQLFPFFQEISA